MSITVLTEQEAERIAERSAFMAFERAKQELFKPFPDVMDLPQVCRYLNVTAPTIRERIKHGLPVSYKLGEKSPRFIRSEIDKWLKETK